MDVMLLNEAGERIERRKALVDLIQSTYPDKSGAFLLCAGYEREREQFYQDSTFHYFLGLQEAAAMFYQPLQGTNSLFLPNYSVDRTAWLPITFDEESLASLAIEQVELLGKPIMGYSTGPFYTSATLETLIDRLTKLCQDEQFLFTPLQDISTECLLVMRQLFEFVPGLKEQTIDISPLIAQLRRTKSQSELEYLYNAAEITAMAHQAAAGMIKPGAYEADVQAAIEYIYTESGARPAFASIVGSGVNGTILHYVDNSAKLPDKGLVVVDIGASAQHYCSDVTRTYPVSGKFSETQKKVYQDVLDCQSYIAQLAAPGMFLRNKKQPEKCLNTLAHEFLQKRGYDVQKVFPHGVGHFVGLDVHDVGDYNEPLAVGDIITIEPGIYLRDKEFGVRIEDVYWIVKDGAICLTEEVPKKASEVERFMQDACFTDNNDFYKTGPNEH
jgi:Xaa-Pro aminopeptidase